MTRRRLWWGIVLAGMALRLAWGLAVPVVPLSDSAAYHAFARTLAEHGVYGWTPDAPSAYWAVGTSALAAATYLVVDGFAGVVALNLLAGLAILVLTERLATRWFGARTGLWAMALVAAWPNLIVFTSILSSELFFIAATLAGLFFWRRPAGRPLANLALAGLVWGLAAYIRPVILLAPVALALAEAARGPRAFAGAALQAGVAMALIVAVALPWTLRNEAVLGGRAMISTNFGANLWMGNNPASDGGYMPLPPAVAGMGEIERGEVLKARVAAFVRDDPAAAIGLLGRKLVMLHDRETIGIVWNEEGLAPMVGPAGVTAAKALATGYWYLILAGGLAGVAVLARAGGVVAALFNPPVALWGYFTAIHVVVVAQDRYHMPASAYIAVMAAVALEAGRRRLAGRRAEGAGMRAEAR